MKLIKKMVFVLTSPAQNILASFIQRYCSLLPDRLYLYLLFYIRMGYKLKLKKPISFSEKLQWLKLYDRNPLYIQLVDKYNVKRYVAEKIGIQYIIPTIGVWDDLEKVQWDILPRQFVLKTTQGGGNYGVVVCKDKANFDKRDIVKRLRKALNQNIYKEFREWPYKDVKKRIIAEKYMEQDDGANLIDYKFFCFNGEPKFLYVRWLESFDQKEHINFLTMKWEAAPFWRPDYLPSSRLPHKPVCFEEMCFVSKELSSGIPFVRVDLYEINNKVFFSELTFFPSSGLLPFVPQEWDYKLGDFLELPKKEV